MATKPKEKYTPVNRAIPGGGKYVPKDRAAGLPKKPTLGQKVLNIGTKVNKFFGGEAVADKLGAKIAKSRATPEEKKYITEPTNKQVAASAAELGLNIAGLIPGLGVAAVAAKANKVRYGLLAAEGAGYAGSQAALRGVQDQKPTKEILKDTAIATGIGAVAGPLLGRLLRGKTKIPTKEVENLVPPVGEVIPTRTPIDRHASYANKMGYEPIVPDNQLPTISAADKAPQPKVTKQNGYTYTEVKPTITSPATPEFQAQTGARIETPGVETPRVETPQVKVPEEKIYRARENFKSNATPEEEVFISQRGNYDDLIEGAYNNAEQTNRIALGLENPPVGVPKNLYASVAKNLADDVGDFDMIMKLKEITPARTALSKGAAEMRASQITHKDNISDVIYKLENDRLDQLSNNMKSKVSKDTETALKEVLDEYKNFRPTRKIINEIADFLICK